MKQIIILMSSIILAVAIAGLIYSWKEKAIAVNDNAMAKWDEIAGDIELDDGSNP